MYTGIFEGKINPFHHALSGILGLCMSGLGNPEKVAQKVDVSSQ